MEKRGNTRQPRTVDVDDTADLLSPAGQWVARIYKNIGAQSVFLGAANVAATGANLGYELKPGEEFTDERSLNALYGVCGAALSSKILVWEVV